MKSILATLALAKQDLPEGVEAGQFQVTMSAPGVADVVQLSAEGSFTFHDLAPGEYVFSAVRLAVAGHPISAPVSASLLVPAPVQFDAPASITLTLV